MDFDTNFDTKIRTICVRVILPTGGGGRESSCGQDKKYQEGIDVSANLSTSATEFKSCPVLKWGFCCPCRSVAWRHPPCGADATIIQACIHSHPVGNWVQSFAAVRALQVFVLSLVALRALQQQQYKQQYEHSERIHSH